ncbi:MAG: type VI secretion system tube protein Hcp [Myxococcota bacterium]
MNAILRPTLIACATLVAAIGTGAPTATAQEAAYLFLDGISGESTTPTGDGNAILCVKLTLSGANENAGGATGGVFTLGPVTCRMQGDRSAPALLQASVEGAPRQAEIRTFRGGQGGPSGVQGFYTLRSQSAIVNSIRFVTSVASGEPPLIEFELLFQTLEIRHEPSGDAYNFEP